MAYIYPTNEQLQLVAQQKIATLTMDDEIFTHFPMVNVDSHILSWEQRDNYKGLQQVRGLDGQAKRVNMVGGKRYTIEPGIYGEFAMADELELTARRQWGTYNTPIDVTDIVAERQDYLLSREISLVKSVLWKLVTTGTFTILDEQGIQKYAGTFPIQSFTAGVTWATSATATPLANFRSIQLLSRGYSVNFGAGAKAYMNRTTFNNMISNTNNLDIAGRRTSGLLTVLNLEQINGVLAGEGLPMIVIYDDGYYDETGTFQLYIPNNRVAVIGTRPAGQSVGDYAMTRNANNPNMEPGRYTKVVDDNDDVPRTIVVHSGHNGAPRVYFPSALVSMIV